MHAQADHARPGDAPRFRRVLVKLSGEAMAGGTATTAGRGIDGEHLARTAREIAKAARTGAELVIIPGGGNILRGAELASHGLVHRDAADQMGMLGTVINAIALREALGREGTPAEVYSALPVPPIAPALERTAATEALERGSVVIAAAGVGQPYFSTDSGAAMRAAQLGCDAIIKATKVDGVYDDDPAKNPNATRFDELTIDEAIDRRLRVMDLSALTLCRETGVSIAVCNFHAEGNLAAVISGGGVGTVISPG